MKLCFILVCLFSFGLSATTRAQQERVSLKLENVTVKTLLDAIQSQTKLHFLLNREQTARLGVLSVDVKDETVEAVLDRIFQDSDLTYKFMDDIIVVKDRELQQKNQEIIIITGTVLDEDKKPVPGVTIMVKNSVLGTATDLDGKYAIKIPHPLVERGLSLTFSFIGMKSKEVKYNGSNTINVVLEEDKQELDEVVVTGYQRIDKRVLTSSIETVKAEDLDKTGVLTVDQMLEGKATGLMVTNLSGTPGAAAKIRVRSGGTFTGSRAPLWVIDEIIYEDPVPLSADDINSFDQVNLIGNALTGLNPQDIESINILKDASATAIYGTRAANGVIVVTTKRGKKGRASISYSGSMSVVDRPHYSDFNLMNSRERVDVSREIAQKNLGYSSSIFTYMGYEAALKNYRDGSIDFSEFQNQVGKAETMNTDWFGELYRPAINTTHNLNVSGGSESMRYYFSVGYDYNQGTERGVGLNRITARSNVDLNLRKNVLVSLGMSGSVQEAQYNYGSVNVFNEAYYTSRTVPVSNEDGTPFFMQLKLMEKNNIIRTGGYNILHEMDNSSKNIDNKDFNINAQMSWDIVQGIKLRASASYRSTTNLQEEWIKDNTFYIAKLRTYDNVNDKIDDWVKTNGEVPFGGVYSAGMTQQTALRGQVQLNFAKVINNKHVFNLNVGYEANTTEYKGSSGWKSPGYDHDQGRVFIPLKDIIYTTGNSDIVDYAYSNALKWMTGNGNNVYPTITDRLSNSLSAFLIFNYSYDDRYVFNFNMRSDGSNSFGQYERYKFKPTWSVSGRWNLHKEHFIKNDFMDELALKASYGFRGNPPSATPYMVINKYEYDPNFGEMTSNMGRYPNANLTWEKTSTLNLGISHSWLGGRLSGAFDFAYSHGTDLLLSRPVSLVNGQSTQQYNGGEKKDYSYEISLRGTVIRTKDWGLSLSANMTMTKEEVLAGYEADAAFLDATDYLNGNIYLTGFPVDAFYSYQFDGLDNAGLPKYKNLTDRKGTVSEYFRSVLTYSGRRSPKVYGGFNTEVRYKNLTMRAGFSYKAGNHVRRLALYDGAQNMPMPHENMSSEFNRRWRQPGDEAWAVIPGLSNNRLNIGTTTGGNRHYIVQDADIVPNGASGYSLYDLSDIRVVNGSHIRWQSLSINYRFPDRYIKKLGFNALNVAASASNLAVWAFDKDLNGQDPEQVRNVGMPALPTYSLSINFGF